MDRDENKSTKKVLSESLLELGAEAFDPTGEPASRSSSLKAFNELVQRSDTLKLVAALNKLIVPGRVPPWLGTRLMAVLAELPMRPDGVRNILEFVFAVHPSSILSNSEAAAPQTRGANITEEALKMATGLLASPPSLVDPDLWFSKIAPQLLLLLDGHDGYEMTKVASYVIGFGILGRKKFGAPGSPGWNYLASPLLTSICPSNETRSAMAARTAEQVVDLTKDTVLQTPEQLALSLRRLQALIISHPNHGLTRRLLKPILLPLWCLTSWHEESPLIEENYRVPARNLLKIYLVQSSATGDIESIIRHLSYNGSQGDDFDWQYQSTADEGIQAVNPCRSRAGTSGLENLNLEVIAYKSKAFVDLLEATLGDDAISGIFLDLFSRWHATQRQPSAGQIIIKEEETDGDPIAQLMEANVMQRMMEHVPKKLVGRAADVLRIVDSITSQHDDGPDSDETIAVALSLLNLVITAPGFRRSQHGEDTLISIERSLERLSKAAQNDNTLTASNLLLLLRYRTGTEDDSEEQPPVLNQRVEDQKTYNLALSYITQTDSPPPVRGQGLNLIQKLIDAASPVLDIPAVLVLLSSLLTEDEDYITLRVVKVYTNLANKHPKSTTKELLDHFIDPDETAEVDTRLRFGEALLQVIERLGQTFAGEAAEQVGQALLTTAGRRRYRAKTEKKQARDARLKDMKKAREGEDEDEVEVDEGITDEEKARREILGHIVTGWESKRGTEDVRIRSSALSILSQGIETNVAGLGPSLTSTAVDLSINILTMEPEIEKGILRRSAVILIFSFVQALDKAKEEGRRLGFGLTAQSQEDILRVLNYIASTDNDGLVKQHANDVVESLENWRLSSLLPDVKAQQPGLSRLAGLTINPGGGSTSGDVRTAARPRIEEIE